MTTMVRRVARPMLAAAIIAQGVDVIRHPQPHADKAAPIVAKAAEATGIPDTPERYVRAQGAVLVGAGLALGAGVFPRAAGWAVAGLLAPTTVLGHQFWRTRGKEARSRELAQFLANTALVGGALLAGVDTSGRPSFSWRRDQRKMLKEAAAMVEAEAAAKAAKAARKSASKAAVA